VRTLRSLAILLTACFAAALLAACTSKAPVTSSGVSAPALAKTHPSAVATTLPTTAASPATSAQATPPSAAGCVTSAGFALPSSSITVCPSAGPVGSVVHVTIKDCAPAGAGLPSVPAAGLFFLGPNSWLGTDGGGGAGVPYSPQTGSEATAVFTIPATYVGGNEDGPYPTLEVTPGTGYEFITDPAGECSVPFTVTAS
jgi:hypothetical protein